MPFIGGGGIAVKSIQRGTTVVGVNSSATATINAVDLVKSFISSSFKSGVGSHVGYHNLGAYAYGANSEPGATLTNGTTVTMYAGPTATSATMSTPTCYWEVIEYA